MSKLTESNKTRRLFTFGAIFVGLLVAFGLGKDGFHTVRTAEATTTDWMYPASGGPGIQAPGNAATESPGPIPPLVPAVCTNCYITSIVPDLVYQNDPDMPNHPNGTTANYNNNSAHNIWMHHMVIVNACNPSERIFASGNERTTWSLPAGYGYYQNCSSGWYVNYHLHNNSSATRGVALKLTITYTTGTLKPVTPFWLDTGTTGNASEFIVQDGYTDTHTSNGAPDVNSDWTSPIQGAIVAIGGHVHDYGISTAAYNNRLGGYICISQGVYGTGSRYLPTSGGPGTPGHPVGATTAALNQSYHEANGTPDDRYHIQGMTACTPTGAQAIICVGDVIRLHTQYNSPDFPISDAMGIISGDVDPNQSNMDGDGTIDACDSDIDGDGVANGSDNCPNWANASQALPTWPVPTGDSDCDSWPGTVAVTGSKAAETYIGTDPLKHCALTSTPNDEPDAWPPDLNDDRASNGADNGKFGGLYGAANHLVSQGPFGPPGQQIPGARFDFNGDGAINGQDFGKYQISQFGNKVCFTP